MAALTAAYRHWNPQFSDYYWRVEDHFCFFRHDFRDTSWLLTAIDMINRSVLCLLMAYSNEFCYNAILQGRNQYYP
jgi:hypothetical protein